MLNIVFFAGELMGTIQSGQFGGFSILWGMNGETLYRLGANDRLSISLLHEWYRLITAMFLHGGLIHIGVNMMVVFGFGPLVGEGFGSARYFFLYVVVGAASFSGSALGGQFFL